MMCSSVSDSKNKELYREISNIYNEIKTPYKYGIVIEFDDYMADSPTVFKYNNKWYMFYVRILYNTSVSGYETHFSSSDDLVHWKYEGIILPKTDGEHWDSKQTGGYAAFLDIEWGGENSIQKVNDKYYMAYIGGWKNGYETAPLSMGLAYSDNPIAGYKKFEDPVLSPCDEDAREFERKTIYKANMFVDEAQTLGYRYVNFYNSQDEVNKERIYCAVSNDGEKWIRFGKEPVIDEINEIQGLKISGDPQIVKIDDIYVMFFFRVCEGCGAYNTFAISKDLINWKKWEGDPLIKGEQKWENRHAHKSFVLKHEEVVYHFYCAVNDEGKRCIALATSEKIF